MTGPSLLEAGLSSSVLLQAAVTNNAVTATASRMTNRCEYERIDGNFILFVIPVDKIPDTPEWKFNRQISQRVVCCMS
jgi:hypothetical protein